MNNAPWIKDVLERLDWDRLYYFHNHRTEVTRDAFHGFIGFDVRNGVDQAIFYDIVRNLFMYNDTEYYLQRLQNMYVNQLPSEFAFIFFKAVYRMIGRVDAANELVVLFDKVYLRNKICKRMNLLHYTINSLL